MHHLCLIAYFYQRADSIAIAFCATEVNLEPVIFIASVVPVKISGAVVGGYQNIEVAVVVEIAVGCAAGY